MLLLVISFWLSYTWPSIPLVCCRAGGRKGQNKKLKNQKLWKVFAAKRGRRCKGNCRKYLLLSIVRDMGAQNGKGSIGCPIKSPFCLDATSILIKTTKNKWHIKYGTRKQKTMQPHGAVVLVDREGGCQSCHRATLARQGAGQKVERKEGQLCFIFASWRKKQE